MLRAQKLSLLLVAAGLAPLAARPDSPADSNRQMRFRVQEIENRLKVGYAVTIADVNGDGKPDIVVVDTNEVVWYENPSWQKRIIVKNEVKDGDSVKMLIKEDNVCIAAADIDGDGKIDFALGAGWPQGFRTTEKGTIQWLKQGASLDEPWTVHPIGEEPMVHRMRFVDLEGDGKLHLVVAPLMGRGSTHAGNWCDGRPVRILDYPIPADPIHGPWKPRVLSESLNVVHGFTPVPGVRRKGFDLLVASYDGVSRIAPLGSTLVDWAAKPVGAGNQDSPLGARGSSEVAYGKLRGGKEFIATVEPWHGNQVVVYLPPDSPERLWDRELIDSRLRWGHAVCCADLDGHGSDDIIVGVRDDPGRSDLFKERRGVRIYRFAEDGRRWGPPIRVDEGAVAVESLAVADLNGDGRLDIIVAGRQTGNVRIYWNEK